MRLLRLELLIENGLAERLNSFALKAIHVSFAFREASFPACKKEKRTQPPHFMASPNSHFLRAFLRNKSQVGALTPSGDKLADAMVDWIDWSSVKSAVEFGPGTGVFTEKILTRLRPDSKFFAVEQDEHLADITRARCPGARVHTDCVSNISAICEKEEIDKVDVVISGLPWAVFTPELQKELLVEMKSVLKPGGKFVTFAYLQGMLLPAAQRFRKLLNDEFVDVHQSKVVWGNVPPAFVYRSVREDAPSMAAE